MQGGGRPAPGGSISPRGVRERPSGLSGTAAARPASLERGFTDRVPGAAASLESALAMQTLGSSGPAPAGGRGDADAHQLEKHGPPTRLPASTSQPHRRLGGWGQADARQPAAICGSLRPETNGKAAAREAGRRGGGSTPTPSPHMAQGTDPAPKQQRRQRTHRPQDKNTAPGSRKHWQRRKTLLQLRTGGGTLTESRTEGRQRAQRRRAQHGAFPAGSGWPREPLALLAEPRAQRSALALPEVGARRERGTAGSLRSAPSAGGARTPPSGGSTARSPAGAGRPPQDSRGELQRPRGAQRWNAPGTHGLGGGSRRG